MCMRCARVRVSVCNSGISKNQNVPATTSQSDDNSSAISNAGRIWLWWLAHSWSSLAKSARGRSWSQQFRGRAYEHWKRRSKGQHTSCLGNERYGVTIINADILPGAFSLLWVNTLISLTFPMPGNRGNMSIPHLKLTKTFPPRLEVTGNGSLLTRKQLVSQLSQCIWTPENGGTSHKNPVIPSKAAAVSMWNPLKLKTKWLHFNHILFYFKTAVVYRGEMIKSVMGLTVRLPLFQKKNGHLNTEVMFTRRSCFETLISPPTQEWKTQSLYCCVCATLYTDSVSVTSPQFPTTSHSISYLIVERFAKKQKKKASTQ